MNRYVVDFESYYDKKNGPSVSSQGNRNYIRDSYAYCVSVVGPDVKWVGTIPEAMNRFGPDWWTSKDHQLWAANAGFDQSWAESILGTKLPQWNCILDLARVHQLPGNLADLSRVVLKNKVDKKMRSEMSGVHFAALPAERQQAVLDYCLNDAVVEYEVLNTLPPASDVEMHLSAHTRMTNARGIRLDWERMAKDKERLLDWKQKAEMALPWHLDAKPLSPLALAKWAKIKGIELPSSLAKDSEDCDEKMLTSPELKEVVTLMRRYRKANTLIEKIESMEARMGSDGRMPLELLYCGAPHTRRWSSRGVNVQNLDRDPYWLTKSGGEEKEGWSVWTRRYLIADEGYEFYIPDYSQIEPRCLNWLVGNEEFLAEMSRGTGPYEAFARVIGKWSGPGRLKEGDPTLYKLMKAEVLGLGYRMGADRFIEAAAKEGLTITKEESKKAIEEWKAANPKIVRFWSMLDEKIREALMSREKRLSIQMPSGEYLSHYHLQTHAVKRWNEELDKYEMKPATKSYTVQGDFGYSSIQNNLHGGPAAENCCQRFARDVFGHAILNLEGAGFPVIFHSHDEPILQVPLGHRREVEHEVKAIMSKPPPWAKGLPLAVGGVFSPCYLK